MGLIGFVCVSVDAYLAAGGDRAPADAGADRHTYTAGIADRFDLPTFHSILFCSVVFLLNFYSDVFCFLIPLFLCCL